MLKQVSSSLLRAAGLALVFFATQGMVPELGTAQDSLVLVDQSGQLFHWVQESKRVRTGAYWSRKGGFELLPESQREFFLTGPDWSRPRAESGSGKLGTSVVVDDSSVHFKVATPAGDQIVASGLRAPPPGFQYSRAHLDQAGHLFVELSGAGKGLSFLGAEGKPFVPASRLKLSDGSALPDFSKWIPNPMGAGVLGLKEDGSLWLLLPPKFIQGRFELNPIAPPGRVQQIALSHQQVLVLTRDGTLGYLEGLTDLDSGLKPLARPRQAVGSVELFSSYDSQAGERVRARLQTIALRTAASPERLESKVANEAQPPAPAKSHSASLLPVPLSTRGSPPVSVLLPLDGSIKYADFKLCVERVFNDQIALERYEGKEFEIFGREKETQAALDTLVRVKGKNPVLVGEPGVGKTTVAERIAYDIESGKLPVATEYQSALKGAIVIQTSPGLISRIALSNDKTSQIAAVEKFLDSARAAEKALGRRIIVYVDEMHNFSPEQLEAFKTSMDSRDGLMFLGSTTHGEYLQMIGRNGALERRLQPIKVEEFSVEETRALLKKSVVPVLEKKFGGKDSAGNSVSGSITDEAIDSAIRRAPEYLPNSRRPEGPFKLLQDAMILAHREAGSSSPRLEARTVSRLVVERLGLPADPEDAQAFQSAMESLAERLRTTVVDQHRVTDAMVELWKELQQGIGSKDHHRVLLIAGPTGAGKTFSAQEFARVALGGEARFLEVDATKYSTGGLSLNSLLGAPPGVLSSNQFKGLLPEFLSGRGSGTNVIVINELDKAHPDLMKALMEMLDSGKLQGGDGRTYHLGKSLVVLTTNKGDDQIYPRGRPGALARTEIEARLSRIKDSDVRAYFMQPDGTDLYDQSRVLPPSVLNRIDRAVPAAPPSYEGALKIAQQEVQRRSQGWNQVHGYRIEFEDAVIARLVEVHYVPEDGVRDLKRAVGRQVTQAMGLAQKELALGRGDALKVSLGARQLEVINQRTGVAKNWDAPELFSSPQGSLADPAIRSRLATLEQRLGQTVYGQEEAVKMTARALRVQQIHSGAKTPVRLLYLGTTGTGKTELGKAIALEHYGNEGRLIAFDMGSVKWQGDLNNIFGAARAFKGSGERAPFEKFLVDFPEGGVIVFDEIGNMGGGSASQSAESALHEKTQMLQKFYSMLDEGRWVSPLGKTYDLSKYTLVFTSNEGQELLAGLPSDDLRRAAWNESKGRETLQKLLKEHGWPEPLIARFQGNITLFKPLSSSERVRIAKKLVDRVVQNLVRDHGLKSINFESDFFEQMGDTFFSHDEGARALKAVSDGALVDIVGNAIFENYDPERLKDTTLHLSLKDSHRGLYSHRGRAPPRREVVLRLELRSAEGTYQKSVDLADQAVVKRLSNVRDTLRTAYHEAGHAIMNDPARSGRIVEWITLHGQGGYAGYVRFADATPGALSSLTRENVVYRIASLLAGDEAERLQGFPRDSGWGSDLEKARKLAEEAITKYGLLDQALDLPTRKGTVDAADPRVQREIQKLLHEGSDLAKRDLTQKWTQLRAVVSALMKTGELRQHEFERIVQESAGARPRVPKGLGCPEGFSRLKNS
ncbi:MAG: AAA family ATPase [Oligoflexia bacterium]